MGWGAGGGGGRRQAGSRRVKCVKCVITLLALSEAGRLSVGSTHLLRLRVTEGGQVDGVDHGDG